jgi:hypothetical protein
MIKKANLILGGTVLCFVGHVCLIAEPTAPSKPKPADKTKEAESKEVIERTVLSDFLAGIPYSRDSVKKLPSPFRNLIVAEKNKIKAAEAQRIKDEELEKIRRENMGKNPDITKPIPSDPLAKELLLVQEAQKSMEIVMQLVEIRKYEDAEAKLTVMDTILSKNNVEKYRDVIAKKKIDVVEEHKDWDEINKIINALTVDAMFVAEGKKKVALINDVAVEEGDDLNELLSLNKNSSITLTFVSSNSIKIKYKKFTLQKELIDNDL